MRPRWWAMARIPTTGTRPPTSGMPSMCPQRWLHQPAAERAAGRRAVVYINGVEVGRFNMPEGTSPTTPARRTRAMTGAHSISHHPASLLVEGRNVLAVEIHQATPTSSDISFDLELAGLPSSSKSASDRHPGQPEPFGQLCSSRGGAPGGDGHGCGRNDRQGGVFCSGSKIAELTNAPYACSWSNMPRASSPSRRWPRITKAQPPDRRSACHRVRGGGQAAGPDAFPHQQPGVRRPTNVTMSARASAQSGVASVVFLANGTALGTDTTPPYSLVWSNASFGRTYSPRWRRIPGATGPRRRWCGSS